MRKLKLNKPIVFFDLETTGTDPIKDRIVSISATKYHPDGSTDHFSEIINPEIEIPESVSAIHGITNEMVKDKKTFRQIFNQIHDFFNHSDIAGFNCNYFDIPLLSAEFDRVTVAFPEKGTKFVDVGNLFKILNPRTLSAAYKHYTGSDLEGAHNADADNDATYQVLVKMLEKHEELPLSVEELSLKSSHDKTIVDLAGKFKINDQGHYEYTFGKHKGERVGINNSEYLGWMINKGDFHPDTKRWARKFYDDCFPPIDFGSGKQEDLPF